MVVPGGGSGVGAAQWGKQRRRLQVWWDLGLSLGGGASGNGAARARIGSLAGIWTKR